MLLNLLRKQDGQSLVLLAVMMVGLMGFAALVIDGGNLYLTHTKLQNAADAAALAGAQSLPTDQSAAKVTANKYGGSLYNGKGIEELKVISKTYVDGDADVTNASQIKVVCQGTVQYTFARVLGLTSATVSATAIAENLGGKWGGDALPFLNVGFDYSVLNNEVGGVLAWTKVGPGIKETISDFYTRHNGSATYFEVAYQDGITLKNGFADGEKGLDDSKLKDGLDVVLTPADKNVKVVYLFSVRDDIIRSGSVKLSNGKTTAIEKLKNGDVINVDQLVLLECRFIDLDWQNHHNIQLTYLGNVYDLGNNNPNNPLPNFPTEDLSIPGGTAKLIK